MPPRPQGYKELLREACRLRREAFAADPEQLDECWPEFGNHEQFMRFYSDVGVA